MTQWFFLAPEVLLLTLALAIVLIDLWVPERRKSLTYSLTQFSLLLVAGAQALLLSRGDASSAFGGLLQKDALAHFLGLMGTLAVMVSLAYAQPYVAGRQLARGETYTLTMFSLLGVLIIVSSSHFLLIYLGLELMSLSLYALVALRRDSWSATEAAMKYFVLGALASGFLLYGLSLVYGATGSLDIRALAQLVPAAQQHTGVLVLGLVFVVAGLAFKLGAVPFHMWVPDVYQGAPTVMTLLVASAPKFAAFAMVFKLLVIALGGLSKDWQPMLVILALSSMFLGNVAAIAQTNLKRMLAYSTIAHMGFVIIGFSPMVLEGTASTASHAYGAALFYLVTYVLTTLASFGMLMLLSNDGHECEQLSDIRGLWHRKPWAATALAVLMFSLAGIPPTVGFYGKLQVLQALVATNVPGYVLLAVLAVVFSLIGAFYYLRVVKLMFFDTDTQELAAASPVATFPAALLMANAGLVLALGLFPNALLTMCTEVIGRSLLP